MRDNSENQTNQTVWTQKHCCRSCPESLKEQRLHFVLSNPQLWATLNLLLGCHYGPRAPSLTLAVQKSDFFFLSPHIFPINIPFTSCSAAVNQSDSPFQGLKHKVDSAPGECIIKLREAKKTVSWEWGRNLSDIIMYQETSNLGDRRPSGGQAW